MSSDIMKNSSQASPQTMSPRDLVRRALAHQATPRPPYCIQFTPQAMEILKPHMGDLPLEDFVANDARIVFGPWWGWKDLGEDWQLPDTPQTPERFFKAGKLDDFRRSLGEIRRQGNPYIVSTYYGSHFEKANFARGIENFLADMAADPPFARKLLTSIVDRNLVMIEEALRLEEIDAVLLGGDWGSQQGLLMSPQAWDDLIRPGEQREYDLIKAYGKDVWVHSCGKIDVLIPRLIEMGVDVLNPVQPEVMDLASLKRDFGSRITFWGGLGTQRILPRGTPQQVKEEARQVRNLMSADGGYVFAPSQFIQDDVPVENVLALLEVAREPLGDHPAK